MTDQMKYNSSFFFYSLEKVMFWTYLVYIPRYRVFWYEGKYFSNFLMFGWVKGFGQCFPNLLFLVLKEMTSLKILKKQF